MSEEIHFYPVTFHFSVLYSFRKNIDFSEEMGRKSDFVDEMSCFERLNFIQAQQ